MFLILGPPLGLLAASRFRVELPAGHSVLNLRDGAVDYHADNHHRQTYPETKVGRSELGPCGSGLKLKRCCLGNTASPAAT